MDGQLKFSIILSVQPQINNIRQILINSTFSRDINLAHIFSPVIADGCLVNSGGLQRKLEKKQQQKKKNERK